MEEEYVTNIETSIEEKNKGLKDKLTLFLNGKYFVPIIIILVAAISFFLGRISGLQDKKQPVRVIYNSGEVKGASTKSATLKEANPEPTQSSQNTTAGVVVASKNGTKYHYPWCAGAKQISPQNLITFNSIEEARAAGYSPASNCKGLK